MTSEHLLKWDTNCKSQPLSSKKTSFLKTFFLEEKRKPKKCTKNLEYELPTTSIKP